ncbi:RnfABCDGE type electron transport complex subunit G [Guyparkeria sp. SCN-R1]|uniref:RnfABCDGE type electron transport complex subunit G n=1 Tax=Guyparkeria sp. SCN-R1 TaxID=2341113 RepID=UPI001315A856|nr:RnfABCDGE type electron transport complex subunit G [Guyparkeria sp. SCN-R1]
MINLELRRVVITSVVLAVFFGLGVGFVAYTQQKTADQIELNRQAVLLGQIMAVLQGQVHDNNPAEDDFLLPDPEALELGAPVIDANAGEVRLETLSVEARERAMNAGQLGFRARQDDEVVAVAIPVVTHRGYSGDIRLLVGVTAEGELTGVRVLEQRETPGLGDKIKADKTDWIQGFSGRRLGDPPADDWAVKKDGGIFDQFTGATVSPRAVVGAVKDVLEYVDRHHHLLFDQPPTTTAEEDEHE